MSKVEQFKAAVAAIDAMFTFVDELQEQITQAEAVYLRTLDPTMGPNTRLPTDPEAIAFLFKASEMYYSDLQRGGYGANDIKSVYDYHLSRWGWIPSMSPERYDYGDCGVQFHKDEIEVTFTGSVDQCGDRPSLTARYPEALVNSEITVEQYVQQRAIAVHKAVAADKFKAAQDAVAAEKRHRENDERQFEALAKKLGKTII